MAERPPVTESSVRRRTAHPLDPMTEQEAIAAREILREAGLLTEGTYFALTQLHEPPKCEVLAFTPGDPVERRLFVLLVAPARNLAQQCVVSISTSSVVSVTEIDTSTEPYGQPGFLVREAEQVDQLVRADPRWQAAMKERGIVDTTHCVISSMTPGQFGKPTETGRRIYRALTFHREQERENPWSRPVEGIIATVDVSTDTVLEVLDYGVVAVGENQSILDGVPGSTRPPLKPISIHQPDGPSFTVEGRLVEWQNWSFRVGFDSREGLVLHQVSYQDGETRRPILYRGSVSEMVVPYGDPHPMRSWINYFDAGEYNLGRMATSLELGCDCVGEIYYFDAVLTDDEGAPYTAEQVVCMHEEDYGVLWKHSDFFNKTSISRRSRRLVVSFFCAIGNYDYGFFWYFYQDGTIELEAKLTGIVFANGQQPDMVNPYASAVSPGLVAPYHQHLFCARLDMTVDGVVNRVEEVDVVADPVGPENPYGNAFRTRSTVVESEASAARMASPETARVWKIVNPRKSNTLGENVAYKLVPHASPMLFADPTSSVAKRAAFATRHLWVTRYDPAERYAAGDLPNMHSGGSGLPEYQAADRPLDGTDVVLWHTFGATHIPRPEDWPVMPVEYAGFSLKPVGFFDHNPALDLPDPKEESNGCHARTTPDAARLPHSDRT